MDHHGVCWREGTFLHPQHFQLQDLHVQNQIASASELSQTHHFGFQKLAFDKDDLKRGVIRIEEALGKTSEGTLFRFGPDDVQALDLTERRARSPDEKWDLVLGIRRLMRNEPNVDESGNSRYQIHEREHRDLTSGDHPTLVEQLKLVGRLFIEGEESAGYELLPMGTCMCRADPTKGESFGWSGTRWPVCLRVNGARAPANFLKSKLRDLEDYLRNQTETIRREKSAGLVEFWSGPHTVNIFRYSTLSELRGWLSGGAGELHPFQVYLFLCRILGRLGLASTSDPLPKLPAYQHAQAGRALDELWKAIELHYINWDDSNVRELPFVPELREVDDGRNVTVYAVKGLRAAYFDPGKWDMYLGISLEYLNQSQGEKELFLEKFKNQLYWKMGPPGGAKESFKERLKSFDFPQEWSPTKPGLKRGHWYFNEFERNKLFDQAREANSIVLRIQQSERHRAPLPGTKGITLDLDNRRYTVLFSIWCVEKIQAQ